MATILITGGSGLIGKSLISLLKNNGHQVHVLSRKKSEDPSVFYWDISKNHIDNDAITTADYIIHLAGENIAGKRWTAKQRKLILESRTISTNLLFEKVKALNPKLKGFISASGIGYYGAKTTSKTYTEKDKPADDFISNVCIAWENSVLQFNTLSIRTVILRTGIVLSNKGGALEKMMLPIKFGFGASLGSGGQFMPWIHIDDLCNMYLSAIENKELEGIYNAVAPEHYTNQEFTTAIANTLCSRWLYGF